MTKERQTAFIEGVKIAGKAMALAVVFGYDPRFESIRQVFGPARQPEWDPYIVTDRSGWPYPDQTKPVTLVGKVRHMLNFIRGKQ